MNMDEHFCIGLGGCCCCKLGQCTLCEKSTFWGSRSDTGQICTCTESDRKVWCGLCDIDDDGEEEDRDNDVDDDDDDDDSCGDDVSRRCGSRSTE